MDELLSILSLRPEYFGEEKEAGPFVYNNGEYIGTLKRTISRITVYGGILITIIYKNIYN